MYLQRARVVKTHVTRRPFLPGARGYNIFIAPLLLIVYIQRRPCTRRVRVVRSKIQSHRSRSECTNNNTRYVHSVAA